MISLNIKQLKLFFSRKKYLFSKLEAIAVLVGTIIGAGVFSLPKVAQQSGLLTTLFWFGIVLILIIYLHLAFGEIVLRAPKNFRLPGYAGYYLGASAKKLMLLTTFFTFSFSLLIYLLLGGQFLYTILSIVLKVNIFPVSFLVIFLWLLFSLILLTKNEILSKINFILSFFLIILFFIISLYSLPHFQINNFNIFNTTNRWWWLLPYGVLFYSLNGMVAVPEAYQVLKRKRTPKELLKTVIISGILIAASCYLLFIISVVGVSGVNTSLDAINGLKTILGNGIVIIGAVLGLLAVATSYLIFANYIKNSFINDFYWSPFVSNFLVIFGPLILYLSHFANLFKLMSFVGGMIGGFEGAMILLILTKAKKDKEVNPGYEVPVNKFIFSILFFALLIGALCQMFLII